MTRASLLHILDHVSAISDPEVRKLEQLATAFPYCQTAHLLLAKAAHDKGSMLAGQRLRRAATHASDRQLLRQLIEQQPPAVALLSKEATPTEAVAPLPAAEPMPLLAAAEEEPLPVAAIATLPNEMVDKEQPANPGLVVPVPELEELKPKVVTIIATTPEVVSLPAVTVETEIVETEAEVLPAAQEQAAAENAPEPTPATAPVADLPAAATPEELLPAVAPPIRPPAEAGTSRFEFGLGETLAADATLYVLPVDNSPVTAKAPSFYADPEIGYTIGYGSRLGACLQVQGELTNDLPNTDSFPADALLLEHIATQQPVADAPTPTSLAIIEQFLRKKPRLRAPAAIPPADDEQTDLSVPSTSATPALASESLAKIMVRQGKTAKAIEIYERLMVRQPEKKAYFAAQIDQLKQSE